ncbi:MAG: cyclodeaminase/cyclohydrolase family protein [Ruminococcaceae bacterium]|jgi:formiminotetrahydrofolate cyclodeaminase|nr:cyclodeaminase/cyclohydrolase family protein [Oscillospiraceae bacterium]
MSNIPQWSCEKFADETFSSAPVPGGGGVAALVGSIGAALAGMVCNLTTGKKKYAQYEADIQRITGEARALMNELMAQIDRDAENFYPLSQCYGLPAETDEEKAVKEQKMQSALKVAITAPIDIVRLAYKAIALHKELAEKGSKLAVSDVGCGVLCLKAAMQCGWLNVMINLKSIHDKDFVAAVEGELKPMLAEGEAMADAIYADVAAQLAY